MELPQLAATAAASSTRWIIPAAIGLVVIGIAHGSYFVVPQTDVAFVKRFGKVLDPQTGAMQPGLHFKMPLIDEADLIRITPTRSSFPRRRRSPRIPRSSRSGSA